MPGLCTITARSWHGCQPMPGEFVKAARGRTAFLIVEVTIPLREEASYAYRFRCERHDPASLSPDDVVHPWCWAKR